MSGLEKQDHWSADAYQKAAGFVPKLATTVVQWLDIQPNDHVLDVGCGDGVLTVEIAQRLPGGQIHGIDSSYSMIASAQTLNKPQNCSFEVLDATKPAWNEDLPHRDFDKIFSNAALHWILCNSSYRKGVFEAVAGALKKNGVFVFEMGGYGNVSEMRAAILASVRKRVGIRKALESDPWFFPDVQWARDMLVNCGFHVEKIEKEFRQTRCEEGEGGGVEGWVRLMGKQFFDAVGVTGSSEREDCIKEVVEILEPVCKSPTGGYYIGYVRLRALARKL